MRSAIRLPAPAVCAGDQPADRPDPRSRGHVAEHRVRFREATSSKRPPITPSGIEVQQRRYCRFEKFKLHDHAQADAQFLSTTSFDLCNTTRLRPHLAAVRIDQPGCARWWPRSKAGVAIAVLSATATISRDLPADSRRCLPWVPCTTALVNAGLRCKTNHAWSIPAPRAIRITLPVWSVTARRRSTPIWLMRVIS